jgi:hypothetical protein
MKPVQCALTGPLTAGQPERRCYKNNGRNKN